MIPLSKTQLDYIKGFLEKNQITHSELGEELLDHIASQIEKKITTGQQFHAAAASTFESFRKDEMQEIQSQIISLNQKQLFMKRLSLAALAVLLISFVMWSFNYDPPSRSPLGDNFEITSPFGNRVHPIQKVKKLHKGIDFRAPIGTPVYATSDGVVSKTQRKDSGYGKMITVTHDKEFESLYAQLSKINVTEGQRVKKGELIGLTGSSGASTGPHLHYEIRQNGSAINPIDYLRP